MAQTICPTCCATKRLVEIRCPADCPYLEGAQRHPAAVVRKQQEQDLTVLIGSMGRRLSEMQLQLFFLLGSVIVRYRPDGLVTLADTDVAEAAAAMAGTLEAASRGVIAELAAPSPISEGLRRQLDGMLAELGKGGGARYAAGRGRSAAGHRARRLPRGPGARERPRRLPDAAAAGAAAPAGRSAGAHAVVDHHSVT